MKGYLVSMLLFCIACGSAPKQKAIEILEKGTKDGSVIVRVQAAEGLARVGRTQYMGMLYTIIEDGDRVGMAAALTSLCELQVKTYSPIVVSLTEHTDPLIRTEAYRLISVMDDDRCRDVLIKGAYDALAKIRMISYDGLEKFQDKDAIFDGLRDVDPLVRIAAAQALGRMGEQEMKDFVHNEMNGEENDVWCHSVIALAEMGDTSVIPDIRSRLFSAPWGVRLAAVEALLIMKIHDGVLVLHEALQSDDPFAREHAVNILKKYEISETTQLLKGVVYDEYINVSVAAIEALVQYGTKEEQRLFAELMEAPNPLVQIAAAAAYLQGE